MKILQISSGDFFSTYGGGQVYVKNIVDEMVRQGYYVTIVSFVGKGSVSPRKYNGCTIYEINDDAKLEGIIRELNPSVIHTHSRKGLTCRIAKTLGIPVVVTAHHGGILCPAGTLMMCDDSICNVRTNHKNCLRCTLRNTRTGLYWYPFMRLLSESAYISLGKRLKRMPFIPFITPIGGAALSMQGKRNEWQNICDGCTRMIAPSNAMADAMVRNGMDAGKITVVPHGIPLPDSKAPMPPVVDGKVKFFHVGRIGYVKGLHVLLKAFHNLQAPNAELHLIGEAANKGERRYAASLHKLYDCDKRIIWHGKVAPTEVFNTIKDFHISVSSASYLEVFGLNMAESLAMGKPVLATRNGGAEMQVVDGENGWLVPTNDVEAMKQKMEEIIAHPELWINMDTTSHVVSIENHVKELVGIYEEVKS